MSLFKGILNFVKKPVAFAAKVGGTLIGLPALGSAAGNLINSIGGEKKVSEMAKKAVEAGAVSAQKVEQTLAANNVPQTKENVALVSGVVQKAAIENPQFAANSKSEVPIEPKAPSEASASATAKKAASLANSPFQKFIGYVKQYWFLVLPVSVLLGYSLYKQFIKK